MLTNEHQKLVLRYLPLADKIAKIQFKKTPPQVQFDELQSAAYLGLVDAVTRYDGKSNFEVYAQWRILGEIKDYLRSLRWDRNTNQLASIPEGYDVSAEAEPESFDEFLEDLTQKKLSGIAKRILRMYYGENLTISKIAHQMNLSSARISQLLKQSLNTLKLAS